MKSTHCRPKQMSRWAMVFVTFLLAFPTLILTDARDSAASTLSATNPDQVATLGHVTSLQLSDGQRQLLDEADRRAEETSVIPPPPDPRQAANIVDASRSPIMPDVVEPKNSTQAMALIESEDDNIPTPRFTRTGGQERPSEDIEYTPTNGEYSFTLPAGWTITTDQVTSNDEPLKYDAYLSMTAADGEITTLHIWENVETTGFETIQTYLQGHLAPGTTIEESRLKGIAVQVAVSQGRPGEIPTSVFYLLQCADRVYRFEYITMAGGTQLEAVNQLIASFSCGLTTAESSALEQPLPVISSAELVAAPNSPVSPMANPCQGYWDPNGNPYQCGQCTWWASYSRPDIPNVSWGDARHWNDRAIETPGFTVIATPESGAIAVWESGANGAGPEGHVAFVTWVNGDGSFRVTEMNWARPEGVSPADWPARERPQNVYDSASINYIRGGVTFFEHANFQGAWHQARANDADLTEAPGTSSIYIPAGWDAIFYRNRNYDTSSWRHRWGSTGLTALESSFWDLSVDNFSNGSNMNDNVRSAQVSNTQCLQQPGSYASSSISAASDCGDAPPSSNDTTPPSASGFSASINGGIANITTSGVQDNSGGSGVSEVRFSAKWSGTWRGIGTDSSSPYTLSWDMCSSGVPNGDVELGMEVWDRAGNKWVWSEHHPNPHINKNYSCGGGDPVAGGAWNMHGWMNRYLAGYTNWEGTVTWDGGNWPYIYFDWDYGAPFNGWSGDEFSLRLWRNVYFPGGSYDFQTDADDGVRVYVDGSLVVDRWWNGSGSGGSGRNLSAGYHEVKVEFYENRGDAKLYVVWYGPGYPRPDTNPPSGRITVPEHLTATSDDPITIWAEATDDASGVDRVEFWTYYCQSGTCSWHLLSTDTSAPYSYTWNWGPLGDIWAALAIDIRDRAGRWTVNAGGFVEVYLDKGLPDVSLTQPVGGTYLSGNQTRINATASDSGTGIVGLQYFAGYSDASGDYWHEIGWDTDGSNGWSIDWNAAGVSDQRNVNFFVYAYDYAINYNWSASNDNILDRTAPSSSVQALPQSSPTSFNVHWSGNDATSGIEWYDVQYQKDSGSWQPWKVATASTSAIFHGEEGHVYGFRSRSRDLAGHLEGWPAIADAQTQVRSSGGTGPGPYSVYIPMAVSIKDR